MEMNGEQRLKKMKKTPRWIIWMYVICILVIIGALGVRYYRKEVNKSEPIDFTTNGAVGIDVKQSAFLKIEGLTDEVAIYGNVENKYDSTNDRYYIAFNNGYMYIVDLNYDTIKQLKQIQDYTYSTDENAEAPEAVTVYGVTEEIPEELKKLVIEFYNKSVGKEYAITIEEFEDYFGSVLLNIRKDANDTTIEELICVISGFTIYIVAMFHIMSAVTKGKTKKYLKKNDYEEELKNQLEDESNIEKHYKDKVILTKDYYVEGKNGFRVFKYSDVKWVHIHYLKRYGATIASSIVVHLKDKTKLQCLEIRSAATDEFLGIFNTICERVPEDSFKGYTNENIKGYRQYKKELKKNNKKESGENL